MATVTTPKLKVGDKIYIRTSLSIDHGQDDVSGGLATVAKITSGISAGKKTPFVEVKEVPGTSYNWEILAEEQESLRKQYKNQVAHPDPDFPDHWTRGDRVNFMESRYGSAIADQYLKKLARKK